MFSQLYPCDTEGGAWNKGSSVTEDKSKPTLKGKKNTSTIKRHKAHAQNERQNLDSQRTMIIIFKFSFKKKKWNS